MSAVSSEIAAGLHALSEVNPIAAGVAVVALALVLAIVVLGRSKQIFVDVAEDARRGTFQEQLLAEMQAMRAREAALEAQNARLLEQSAEMRVQLELLREQVRRLIDQLCAVRDGRLAPDGVTVPEAR